MLFSLHHKSVLTATAALTALLLTNTSLKKPAAAPKPKSPRSGLYQFAYEEKGLTIRPHQYIELHPDGQWKMYRLPLASGLRAPQTPVTGTYKIAEPTITFQEAKQSARLSSGPGRPSPVKMARFQGKDFYIISMANHIVISQSASNARYEKVR